MIEFAFESTLVQADAADVLRLAQQVWRNNVERGLTGEMRVSGCQVRQVVEGDIEIVLPLVARVLSDRRHGDICVAALGLIDARRYRDWRVLGLPVRAPATAVPEIPAAVGLVPEPLVAANLAPLRRRA